MTTAKKAQGATKKAAPRNDEPKDAPEAEEVEATDGDSLDGYTPSTGILPDQQTAAEAAMLEARNAGVTGQAVMRSAPTGYGTGAGQQIDISGDNYEVTGGSKDAPTGPEGGVDQQTSE